MRPATHLFVAVLAVSVVSSCGGEGSTAPPSVRAVLVTSVHVSGIAGAMVQGRSAQAAAEPRDAQGATLTNRQVTWSTSNAAVLALSQSQGPTVELRALQPGVAVITAASEGKQTSVTVTVAAPRVLGVTVTPSSRTITAGDSLRLSAVVDRDPEAPPGVVWSSSNTLVATVDTSGVVVGRGPGQVVITASARDDQTKVASAVLIVQARVPQISRITLSPTSAELFAGTSTDVRIAATGEPGANPAVTWTSTNPAVATAADIVPGTLGRISGVSEGTATITAISVASPTVFASMTVTVRAPRVADIRLSVPDALISVGGTAEISATVIGEHGAVISGLGTVTSSDTTVATVLQVGNRATIRGVRAGTARITFPTTNPNVAATATVTVLPPPQVRSITPLPSELRLLVGQFANVSANISGDPGADDRVKGFRSSDPAVATVGPAGTTGRQIAITGRSLGTATIFIETSNPEVVGTVRVTVVAPQVRAINVDSTSVTARLPANGGTGIVTVGYQLTTEFGASTVIAVTSSGSDVATAVIGNGVVTITAKSPGTATITLTPESNPSISARIEVTVVRASP